MSVNPEYSNGFTNAGNPQPPGSDRWVEIQQSTFTNWVNEQLSQYSARSLTNLGTDLCDGVHLVALVETLQLKKIGRVYSKPQGQIQRLANVSLALTAITEDNVKLVNIGNEDVVNGNVKLILGLIWHLIVRYQISNRKTKSPPKKLMMDWFRLTIPDLEINNFNKDWEDGIALHALIERLKPGTSPDWRKLHSKNKVENCRSAMVLAKEKLNIPRVISPENFASGDLDELSAMTYLSYFVKVDSPGYYDTLNWVCKQLRTTTITNLTTDWNNGFHICAIVHSLGGAIEGWPDLDLSDHECNWQKALDGGKELGVEPLLKASEMSDPSLDHLTMMTYVARFQRVTPSKSDKDKVKVTASFNNIRTGIQASFSIDVMDRGVKTEKVKAEVKGPRSRIDADIQWRKQHANCKFTPREAGEYQIIADTGSCVYRVPGMWVVRAYMDGEEIPNSPVNFDTFDPQKAWFSVQGRGVVDEVVACHVDVTKAGTGNVTAEVTHIGKSTPCHVSKQDDGNWSISFVPTCPGSFFLKAAFNGTIITGCPKLVDVVDPGQITVTGEGIVRGLCGKESRFIVNTGDLGGNIVVIVKVGDIEVNTRWEEVGSTAHQFTYTPLQTGVYTITVIWNDMCVPGSPFKAKITDRSKVRLKDDLSGDKDENDYLALVCGTDTVLHFDISEAGPGSFNAEVLAPSGKLPVTLDQPDTDEVAVSFKAKEEGDHYIHLYWSNVPLDSSPILSYCPGPILPIDHTKVKVTGKGIKEARAGVRMEFRIDGKLAGPGVPRVELQGLKSRPIVDMKALKYDRYQCHYTAPSPGAYLMYIYWSGTKLFDVPYKISVSHRGAEGKVKVLGRGLKGGFVGQELRVIVDTTAAGYGEVVADMNGLLQPTRCDILDQQNGIYTLRLFPTEACRHSLSVKFDGEHAPGSPFTIPVGEPPDPRKVRVYGPGIQDGLIQSFESKFLVETYGAGAGQLSVRIRGPRGAFKVDMERERQNDRTILCRYDPSEPGQYDVSVRWSGHHVNGSPFYVNILETREELCDYLETEKGISITMQNGYEWTEDV
ncbi:filamin-A-like [Ylistrum balloti]|uniref:filamin-A-like n=1 Tax=Ylistrum balloti TaxID=509963 RepID=UPI002905D12D|nr:filamin-A-like [Ylistrum balloti]